MKELQKALKQSPIIYVTRDLERAIGLPKAYQNYHIISNWTPFGGAWSKGKKNVLLIKEKTLLDTRDLLTHVKTKKYIQKISHTVLPLTRGGVPTYIGTEGSSRAHILVFKNTSQIEKICAENGWRLLNPPSELANKIEEKISQIHWLGPLTKYLPPYAVMLGKDLKWPLVIPSELATASDEESRFIVQFNRAHTGSGTILIESQKQVDEIKQKFPNRELRVTQFIAGPAFTNNNVVWVPPSPAKGYGGASKNVFIGNINYQITGLPPFTNRPFATIGNDWALPAKVLSAKQIKQFRQIANDVGKRLIKSGWKGLFGIDVMVDEKTGKMYLIEINARQPASTTFESQLQQDVILSERLPAFGGKNPSSQSKRDPSATPLDDKNITTFEAHLAALLTLPATSYKLQAITTGSQIIQKTSDKIRNLELEIRNLQNQGFVVIPYPNTEPESDLLRIQSKKGIMEKHGVFNKIGEKIVKSLAL